MIDVPTVDETTSARAEALVEGAQDIISVDVSSWAPEDYEKALRMLRAIRKTTKVVSDTFVPIKRDADRLKKTILSQERRLVVPLKEVDRAISEMVRVYLADSAARHAAASAAFMEATGSDLPSPVEKSEVHVEGVSFRTQWRWEVENFSMVPRRYLTTDDRKISDEVRRLKGEVDIPGIRSWSEKIPVAR